MAHHGETAGKDLDLQTYFEYHSCHCVGIRQEEKTVIAARFHDATLRNRSHCHSSASHIRGWHKFGMTSIEDRFALLRVHVR